MIPLGVQGLSIGMPLFQAVIVKVMNISFQWCGTDA